MTEGCRLIALFVIGVSWHQGGPGTLCAASVDVLASMDYSSGLDIVFDNSTDPDNTVRMPFEVQGRICWLS